MLHNRPLILDFDADYRTIRPFSGLGECTIKHAEELAARIEQIMDDIEASLSANR